MGGPGGGREGGCVRNRVRSAETCRMVSGNAFREKREGGHSSTQYTQVSVQQKMSFESGSWKTNEVQCAPAPGKMSIKIVRADLHLEFPILSA